MFLKNELISFKKIGISKSIKWFFSSSESSCFVKYVSFVINLLSVAFNPSEEAFLIFQYINDSP